MHINVVVIGHVDSGKSTTTGKLKPNPAADTEQPSEILHRSLDLQVRWY
jgi:GTPase